mgnify:CR=1 FL=1
MLRGKRAKKLAQVHSKKTLNSFAKRHDQFDDSVDMYVANGVNLSFGWQCPMAS